MTQTIETQYKNLNNLASRLRQAGAVVSVSKLKDDIFSINLKQLPKTSTVEEIVGIEEDTSVEKIVGMEDDTSVRESDSVKPSKQSRSKATKQSKTKATKQPKPKTEDFNIDTDTIPF